MKPLHSLAFVLALFVLAACSKSEPKPPASPGPVAARPGFTNVSDIPAELRADLESFGKEFQTHCDDGDTNAIRRLIDLTGVVDKACDSLQVNERKLAQFKTGFKEGLFKSSAQLAAQWAQADAKYKGIVLYQGHPAARLRFTSDEAGMTIVDLVLEKDAKGKLRAVNLYNHAMGYDAEEQTRQMAATILADLDQSILERLINKPNLKSEDLKQFGELAKRTARRDFAGVVSIYEALPATLKETVPATGMYLMALQSLGNNDKYKRALKEAGARFKSANFQFMLVDAYFLDKDYDKAVECVDNFMQAVEKDAAFLTLKSTLLQAKGDTKGAHAALLEALKLEPDCAYAHEKGLDILLAAKDYPGTRDSMIFLEKEKGFNFKGAMNDPLWDEFKKAPESKQWR